MHAHPRASDSRRGLRARPFGPIITARGLGGGPTSLAAFDAALLNADLRATLASMQRGRGIHFGAVHTEIASATCIAQPVCALVIAVYASQPW